MKSSVLGLVLVGALVFSGYLNVGCAGRKAVDTTTLAEAVTEGESHVTYTVVPGSIAGMPDNAIAIPTVPGKDAKFESFYPDGTPQWRLETKRSAVLDILLSGLDAIDARKFAEDEAQRQFMFQVLVFLKDTVREGFGLYMQHQASKPPPTSQPSKFDQLKELLADPEIRALLPAK